MALLPALHAVFVNLAVGWPLLLVAPLVAASILMKQAERAVLYVRTDEGPWAVETVDGVYLEAQRLDVSWRSSWLAIVVLQTRETRRKYWWRVWPDSLDDASRRRLYRHLNGVPAGGYRWP